MIQNLDFGDTKYRTTSNHYTSKTHANQRCVLISHLCDKLLFEHSETLNNLEISVLSRVALPNRGNASPKELAIISKCASRVGLSMGGNSHD